jgi:hypothetical protein
MLMRSIAIALLSFNIAAPIANAQSAIGIEIVEYGVYTARSTTNPSRSQAGVPVLTVNDLCHVATTLKVPARLGVHFGFRYKVLGSPINAVIDLTKTVRVPPLHPPGAPNAFTTDKYSMKARVGTTSFTGFNFGSDWQLVLGTWIFGLSYADRKLAELSFEIVDRAEASHLQIDDPTCLPIS